MHPRLKIIEVNVPTKSFATLSFISFRMVAAYEHRWRVRAQRVIDPEEKRSFIRRKLMLERKSDLCLG